MDKSIFDERLEEAFGLPTEPALAKLGIRLLKIDAPSLPGILCNLFIYSISTKNNKRMSLFFNLNATAK